MRDYYDYSNPFNNLANVFNNLGDSFVQAFGFEPRFRQTIPAQDVVIEDVIEAMQSVSTGCTVRTR